MTHWTSKPLPVLFGLLPSQFLPVMTVIPPVGQSFLSNHLELLHTFLGTVDNGPTYLAG